MSLTSQGMQVPSEEISLSDLVLVLWRYRGWLIAATGGLSVLIAAAFLVVYASAPEQKVARLAFTLGFEGIEDSRYPGGQPFQASDIVATPILNTVHKANNLEEFAPYRDFASSLFVVRDDSGLEKLKAEYAALLADKSLTAEKKMRLQKELADKERSLRKPLFSLVLNKTTRLEKIPDVLIGKIMDDCLREWVRYTDSTKGGFSYQIPVYTRNIFQAPEAGKQSSILFAESLRTGVLRVLKNIDRLLELPSARNLRVGESKVSLPEIKAQIEDVFHFEITPLLTVQTDALARKGQLADLELHYESNLRVLGTAREKEESKAVALEEALQLYSDKGVSAPSGELSGKGAGGVAVEKSPVVIHQMGETLLDRLISMMAEKEDASFRQDLIEKIIAHKLKTVELNGQIDYYKDSLDRLKEAGKGKATDGGGVGEVLASTKGKLEDSLKRVLVLIDHIQEIHRALSDRNLYQKDQVYAIQEPVRFSPLKPTPWRKYAIVGVLVFLIGEGSIFLVCLAIDNIRRRARDEGRASTQASPDS